MLECSGWLSAFVHGGLFLYLSISDITLYMLGNWKNNLEDWVAEDWNEDVGDLISLCSPTFTLASDSSFSVYLLDTEPYLCENWIKIFLWKLFAPLLIVRR